MGSNVELCSATLYQPDEVLASRQVVTAELAAYIQRLTATVANQLSQSVDPEILDVIVITRSASQAKTWLVSSLDETPDRSGLIAALDDTAAINVPGGPIAFALHLSIAGALPPAKSEMIIPQQWRDAASNMSESGDFVVPDDLVEYLWSD